MGRATRRLIGLTFGVALPLISGCSGSISALPPVSISVSPSAATVPINGTQQFTATVINTSNTAVTWSLSGSGCMGATCGTLSSTTANPVTYTAPADIPNPAQVTITATSVANTAKSSSATITVVSALPISVSVSPASATVPVNGTQQFTATVTNTSNTAVTWSLSGSGCMGAACGTLSTTTNNAVTYTAPSSPPSPPTVTAVATSVADPTKSGSAAITITSSTSTSRLSGHYAFLFNGFDLDGEVMIGGSFVADGSGDITNGIEDISRFSGLISNLPFTPFKGTYQIGADNRGSLNLFSSQGTSTYRFALNAAGDTAHFIEFDSTGTRGSGILRKQDPTAFFLPSIKGGYALGFSGSDPFGNRIGIVGSGQADGAGKLSGGLLDVNFKPNQGAPTVPWNGTYNDSQGTLASNGRGLMMMTLANSFGPSSTLNLAFYVVSASELLISDMTNNGVLSVAPHVSGRFLQQTGLFSSGSLNGNSVFSLTGVSGASAIPGFSVMVGSMNTDGNGNITGGRFDLNEAGVVFPDVLFTGTYELTDTAAGRGTLAVAANGVAINTLQYVFYMMEPNKAFMLQVTSNDIQTGLMEPQTGGPPFSNSSFSGSFVGGTTAFSVPSVSDISGVYAFSGGSLTGTQDETSPTLPLLRPDQSVAGTYSVPTGSADGRGTLTLSSPAPENDVFYIISPTKIVVLSSIDSGDAVAKIIVIEQ